MGRRAPASSGALGASARCIPDVLILRSVGIRPEHPGAGPVPTSADPGSSDAPVDPVSVVRFDDSGLQSRLPEVRPGPALTSRV